MCNTNIYFYKKNIQKYIRSILNYKNSMSKILILNHKYSKHKSDPKYPKPQDTNLKP